VRLIRKALQDLPKTLDDTYSRLFLEIDDAYREEARVALLWLAFSDRPLQLTELAEAIVVNPQSDPPFNPDERFPDPESVLQILSSLVSIAPYEAEGDLTGTVTLAHFSVKEFLISDRIQKGPACDFAISYPIAHQFLAESCLLYVLHYASSATKTRSRKDLSAFPLLLYASERWFIHINMLTLEEQHSFTPLVLKLLLSRDALSSWELVGILGLTALGPEYSMITSPLYYASSMGLVQVVKELLAGGWDPNGSIKQRPLHKSVMEGHTKAAIALLTHGADVDGKDHIGYSPLHHAAETGKMWMVQLLFLFGAQASPRDERGVTPLHLAALHSHTRIAEFLVDKGAEVEVSTMYDLRTPLHWAAWNESKPLLELFLKHGANINAQNSEGETALHYAARDNQIILQDLLDNGADPEIETRSEETPLRWAAEEQRRESTEKLVKAGARIVPALLSLAKEESLSYLHLSFHLLLEVGMAASEETASLTLLALQECARMRYFLCSECQRILSELSDGHTVQQILPIRNLKEDVEWAFDDDMSVSCLK
jgi:ankyrin repeat domain-containing protein 50